MTTLATREADRVAPELTGLSAVVRRHDDRVASEPTEFTAVVRRHDDRVEIVLRGELDIAGAPTLVAAVAPLLSLAGLWVELDAHELSFLDANGIGWFVKMRNMLRARGGELVVHSPSPQVRRLLEICGLTGLLVGDLAEVSDRVLTGA
jgi:anti-anti-sigma factor